MAAEVTNELMYEVLKEIQSGQRDLKAQIHAMRDEMRAIRTHMAGFQTDIGNLYAAQIDMSRDMERVKTRLNLSDAPH